MKTIISTILILIILNFNQVYSQKTTIPSVAIKSLKGEIVDTKNLGNEGKPFLIVFFGSCCSPSLRAMSNLNDNFDSWVEKYGLKIIAISIDDSRNSKKVAPLARGKGWKFEVYLDENSDFKRAMNITNKPHYILFNGKNQIIWQRNGFMEGIEEEISSELEKGKK